MGMGTYDGVWRAALLAGFASIAAPALAQSATAAADRAGGAGDIVVTATRSGDPVPLDLVGSSVTVIDADALAARDTRIVSDVLRDVPGIAVSRTGPVGGLTDIRIRGTEANQVLVLIDGIKVSDPYQGSFDFGTLGSDPAARIEVLRGQQSALYGSDAIGGVINYITLSGREAPGVTLRGEGGSFGTYDGAGRVAGVAGNLDYALGASGYHTGGIVGARGGTRPLAASLAGSSAKLNWSPSGTFKLTAVGRYNYSRADMVEIGDNPTLPTVDGRTVTGPIDAPGEYYTDKAYYGLVRAELTSLGGRMTTAASAQLAATHRSSFADGALGYGDKGVRYRGSLENTLRFGTDRVKHRLTLAIDGERERFRNTSPGDFIDRSRHTIDTLGVVGQYDLTVDDRLALGASLRHDSNDFFRDATTYHADASYRLPSATRLHAAAGSGIKNPGAFELFDYSAGFYIGNPNLRPEKSKGWEAGIDQAFLDDKLTIGATWFDNRLHDEIYTDYLPPDFTATSLNRTGTTHQRGIEAFAQGRIGPFRADASYTYLHAPQLRTVLASPAATIATDVSAQAVRRPRNIASVNLNWSPKAIPLSANLTVRYSGRQKDVVFTPTYSALYADLDAYTLVNASLSYRLTPRIELFARAENLLDERYEEVFGYPTAGRALYAGVRLSL